MFIAVEHLIKHRSDIPTNIEATHFGVVGFDESVTRRIKNYVFGQFYAMTDFPIKLKLLNELVGSHIMNYSFNLNGKILQLMTKEVEELLGLP